MENENVLSHTGRVDQIRRTYNTASFVLLFIFLIFDILITAYLPESLAAKTVIKLAMVGVTAFLAYQNSTPKYWPISVMWTANVVLHLSNLLSLYLHYSQDLSTGISIACFLVVISMVAVAIAKTSS